MNRLLKYLLIISAIGFFVGCRKADRAELEALQEQSEKMSVERAENVVIRYTDSAILKAKILAPILLRFPQKTNPYTEMPEGLAAEFYDRYGKEESRLSANYGINYEGQKLIKLRDSVRVYNNIGEELRSEELYWNQIDKKIYTPSFVQIIRDGEKIEGTGFESNETFSKYRILNPIGAVKVEDEFEK